MKTTDIYFYINNRLFERDYFYLNEIEKKQLLDQEFKNYLTFKILKLDPKTILNNNCDVFDLVYILNNKLKKEDREEQITNLTLYILGLAGSVIWCIEDDPSFINDPLLEINEIGNWDKLKTHEKSDYLNVFIFVYQQYLNKSVKKVIKKIKANNPIME